MVMYRNVQSVFFGGCGLHFPSFQIIERIGAQEASLFMSKKVNNVRVGGR